MSLVKNSRPIVILVVEDNPADVNLLMEVFSESKTRNEISVAKDGVEAFSFLRKEAPHFETAPTVDLNLPRKDGREVLAELKADPVLMHIPVLVLTSSEAERDRLETYRLHANCFITKPGDLDSFLTTARGIEEFWLGCAKLP